MTHLLIPKQKALPSYKQYRKSGHLRFDHDNSGEKLQATGRKITSMPVYQAADFC